MASVASHLEVKPIKMKKIFHATREQIFQAWTEEEKLKAWFGPEGVKTKSASVDLRIGGKYNFEMVTPDGSPVSHHGTYREINAPDKLVFTWILDGQMCEGSQNQDGETVVTLELKKVDDTKTEVSLTHEFLPSEKAREGHEFGWQSCMDSLDQYL